MNPNQHKSQYTPEEAGNEMFLVRRDLIHRLAGSYFRALWDSPDAVLSLASHSDPDVRAAALVCGTTRWNLAGLEQFQKLCIDIVANADGRLLSIALTELGEIFYSTRNRMAQKIVIDVVNNEAKPNHIRNHAYRTLRRIEFGFEYNVICESIFEDKQLMAKVADIPLTKIDRALLNCIIEESR